MNVVIALSEEIYPKICIQQTATAFAHLCSVRLRQRSANALSAEIVAESEDIMLVHEFLNYLLDLSIEHHLKISREQ